jgi:2-keto-4-pentenoate hydratase/2-oxohepta-3-ene-1,7-dioic acid hydratase in catechol pathway
MRLVTYVYQKEQRVGALVNEDRQVLDLMGGLEVMKGGTSPHFSSMLALIESGQAGLDLAHKVVDAMPTSAIMSIADVKLLAPLPRPVTLRDCGLFLMHVKAVLLHKAEVEAAKMSNPADAEAHMAKTNALLQIFFERPTFVNCIPKCISGPDEDIQMPSYTKELDFEFEFAAVIGKKGKDISREAAKDYLWGYTLFNDWGARDEQRRVMPTQLGAGKGKDFDGSKGLGPCIVTADEIGDPYNLAMVARINGEVLCRGNSNTMYFHFEDAVAELSRSETMLPGEVLGSATVEGGSAMEHGRHLEVGDVVELEMEKIGILRNRVVAG